MEACLIEAQSIAAGQIAARLDWVDPQNWARLRGGHSSPWLA